MQPVASESESTGLQPGDPVWWSSWNIWTESDVVEVLLFPNECHRSAVSARKQSGLMTASSAHTHSLVCVFAVSHSEEPLRFEQQRAKS